MPRATSSASNLPAVIPPAMAGVVTQEPVNDFVASCQKIAELNAEYLRAMLEEAQFDWASSWFLQDPESLYAREWSCQTPMLTIGVHYMSALAELGAAMPGQWMQAWSQAWSQASTPGASMH